MQACSTGVHSIKEAYRYILKFSNADDAATDFCFHLRDKGSKVHG